MPHSLRVDAVLMDAVDAEPSAVDAANVHGLLNAGGILVVVAGVPAMQVRRGMPVCLHGWCCWCCWPWSHGVA